MLYEPIPVKRCTKCGQWLPRTLEFFYYSKSCKDKLHGSCKKCLNIASRQWFDPVRHREVDKAYRQRNPEKVRRLAAESRKRHKIHRHTYDQSYVRTHPERTKAHYDQRQERLRQLPNTFTEDDWRFALEYFNNCCAVCQRPLNGLFHRASTDHWIPIHHPDCPGTIAENIVPLCYGEDGCNNTKFAHMPDEWLRFQYGDQKAKQILARIEAYFEAVRRRK